MHFVNATLILPDRLIAPGSVVVENGKIAAVFPEVSPGPGGINLAGNYLAPGFIDLHVHGGDNADFMDLTPEAFLTVARCHARHGTTAFTPTSTVARRQDYLRFLEICQVFLTRETGGARILGGHLYGPYFHPPARGCHPSQDFLPPDPYGDQELLTYAGQGLTTLTVAPETPGTEQLVRAARQLGVLVTAGHSYATFDQVEQAVGWGVRHVDHLFCAMSDRARLRQALPFPMRAGLMEATLYHDDLTTEVIADGMHLSDELLRFAFKLKGADRLALVTDAMRAVDCPDGEYWFGKIHEGERIRRTGTVGTTLDGSGLASGVMGMDHAIRTMARATGAPLPEVIRMASLTPARILGVQAERGSLEVGKVADLVVLDRQLRVLDVYLAGHRLT